MQTNERVSGVSIDVGLRDHMNRIYGLLAKGIALSAVSAFAVVQTPLYHLFFRTDGVGHHQLSILGMIAIFVPLGLLFAQMFGWIPRTLNATRAVFWTFVAFKGVMLATLGNYFSAGAIVQALAITAATFGAMSLYGYTTKRNLGAFAGFLMMGLFGLLLTSIVNMFLGSAAINFAVSVVGVLVFSGFIAWETQAMKEMYAQNRGGEEQLEMLRYDAALGMYINVMVLFRSILNLTSSR